MKTLRAYQRGACDAYYDHIHNGGSAGLITLATGLGKSLAQATVMKELIEDYPDIRILATVHSRELVRQNFEELLSVWPGAPVGINSAGLRRRDCNSQIIFASIQSIYREPEKLGRFDLLSIDECHLLPKANAGMYRSLIAELSAQKKNLKTLGLTATPFRLDSGWLDRGDGALFDKTVYSYGIGEGVRDGYLCPLISKPTEAEIDTSEVRIQAGEFVTAELEEAALKRVRAAVEETIHYGKNRIGWLFFCVGIKHAVAVHGELRARGINAAIVTGKTPADERDATIKAFARKDLRALVTVGIATTGFNVKHVDLIAALRPTQSPGLAIQMFGRGTRTICDLPETSPEARRAAIAASSKPNCLVLDFGRILATHGPIDEMEPPVTDKKGRKAPEEKRIKICPECNVINAEQAERCKHCGQEFPKTVRLPNHEKKADTESVILSVNTKDYSAQAHEVFVENDTTSKWVNVTRWRFSVSKKSETSPDYLRITYYCGICLTINEAFCFDHGPALKAKAFSRWMDLSGKFSFSPSSVKDAFERSRELIMPARIKIKKRGKYYNVLASEAPKEVANEAAA